MSPDEGGLAYTTSVGGPLSHIVVSLFKGGTAELDARRTVNLQMNRPSLVSDREERRRASRQAAADYRQALADGTPLQYVEGATEVDLRSCLHTITRDQLMELDLAELATILRPDRLDRAREDLVVRLSLLGEDVSAGHASLGRDYDEAIANLIGRWRRTGQLLATALEHPDHKLAARVKRALRVPIVLLSVRPRPRRKTPASRRVRIVSDFERFAEADFVARGDGGLQPMDAEPEILPWWHVRHDGG